MYSQLGTQWLIFCHFTAWAMLLISIYKKKFNCEQTKAQFLACKDKNTVQLDREPLSDSNS